MRDLFQGFLLVMCLFFMYYTDNIERKENLNHRNNGIIINITSDSFLGVQVYTKMPNDSIYHDYVYQIAIKELGVGDTIKIIK